MIIMKENEIIITPGLEEEKVVELEVTNDLLKNNHSLNESDAFYYLCSIKTIQHGLTHGIKFKDFAIVSTDFFVRALYRDSFYFMNEVTTLKTELENLCGDSYTLNKHKKCFQIIENILQNLDFEFRSDYETAKER